jgi:hypothetical protein
MTPMRANIVGPACSTPGSSFRCGLGPAIQLQIDRRQGSGASLRAFVSRGKLEKASLDIGIRSRSQITHHTGALLPKMLVHGNPQNATRK